MPALSFRNLAQRALAAAEIRARAAALIRRFFLRPGDFDFDFDFDLDVAVPAAERFPRMRLRVFWRASILPRTATARLSCLTDRLASRLDCMAIQ